MSKQLDYLKASCLSYLSRFERSENRIKRFLCYWEKLKAFVITCSGLLPEEILWDYDAECSTVLTRNERHYERRNLAIISFISLHGLPSEGFHIPICQPFWELPIWCRKVIRNFQKSCNSMVSLTTLSNYEISLSYFFLKLNLASIKNETELTHKVIVEYKDSAQSTRLCKMQRNSDIKSFLRYLEKLDLVKPTLHLVLEPSYQDEAIVLDMQLQKTNSWKRLLESEKIKPIETYGLGISKLKEYLTACTYSQNRIHQLVHGATEFQLFLYSNDFGYSHEIANNWLQVRRPFWNKAEFITNYRAVHLINELLNNKPVSASFTHRDRRKYHIHKNLKHHLQEYIKGRGYEGLQPSSISMIYICCCRFLKYIETQGIHNISLLTPRIVKEFNAQDHHATTEGKQAYNIRIKHFLVFLASKNLVSQFLHLSLPTIAAKKDRIVTVLNDQQKTAIESHFDNPRTKKDKRDNAVLSLGYELGLRAIDIVSLQFSNIDWEHEVITLRQQKTGVWITIPFTTNVGNALYAYITEARPESGSPYVFLSFNAPVRNMASGICRDSVNKVLRKAGVELVCGFHITRKTFASRLLQSGTPFPTISYLLGHSDNTTLKVYLAANEPELRQCAMTLQGIEYRGALL